NVTLGIDTVLDAATTNRTLSIDEGLTLDADFILAGSVNRSARVDFRGEQTVDGSGEIVLSRENALDEGGVSNAVRFVGVSSGDELLTLGADLTLRGQGRIDTANAGDEIDLKGTVRAEDGTLEIFAFDELDGTLSAAHDGFLQVQQDLRMLEQGRLEIGVSNEGAGQIEVFGFLDRAGVLALNVSEDFVANLGDSFEIVRILDGRPEVTGAFQGFEGFDLAGDLAFVLDEAADSLTLRVSTDQEAQDGGFLDGFVPPPPPLPDPLPELNLDVIDGRIADSIIVGTQSGAPQVEVETGGVLEGVSLQTDVRLNATDFSPTLRVEDDLALDATLSLAGSASLTSTLLFSGEQVVSGSGEILFSRENALSDGVVNNTLRFENQFFSREVLSFGENITLRGQGTMFANGTEDVIRVLGTVAGEGRGLELRDIDNAGASFTVDSSAGSVILGERISDAVIEGAAGSAVELAPSAILDDISLAIDGRLGAGRSATIENGLTLLGDVSLAAAGGRVDTSTLTFFGEQRIDGTGEILLSSENAGRDGIVDNDLVFDGQLTGGEILTFGEGVTLRGQGSLSVQDSGDAIRVLGTVAGEGSGFELSGIDNAGAGFRVDSSLGAVTLGSLIVDTVITGVGDSRVNLADNSLLQGVSLDIDTSLGVRSASVEGGLFLGATLSLAGAQAEVSQLTFRGGQSVTGDGTILLSDENIRGLVNTARNSLLFDGLRAGSETLSLDAGVTLRGEGRIDAVDAGDLIDLQGVAIAEGGRLEFSGLETLSGELQARRDGTLEIENSLQLAPQAELSIAVGGSGSGASAGRIEVLGSLDRGGVLRLDVAPDFAAELGDEFEIATATGGFAGAFDSLQGFDFAGPLGFQLVEDGNSLFLRVTEGAAIGTSVARSDLPADPVLPVLSGRIEDQVIDAAFAGGPLAIVNSATFSNVELVSDVTVGLPGVSAGNLTIEGGLTLDGVLGVEGGSFGRSTVFFNGEQTVSGTGAFVLGGSDVSVG
ncbi:hypothetical protein, partial [Denitrobaculum tricleocarpae]|uniref:hypothetical protein n=1 Tax=Denitrobaculum tricleocarpae TaxID=2591009 RepID=UPI0015D1070D